MRYPCFLFNVFVKKFNNQQGELLRCSEGMGHWNDPLQRLLPWSVLSRVCAICVQDQGQFDGHEGVGRRRGGDMKGVGRRGGSNT